MDRCGRLPLGLGGRLVGCLEQGEHEVTRLGADAVGVRLLAVVAQAGEGGLGPLVLLGVGGFGDDAPAYELGFELAMLGGSSRSAALVDSTRVPAFIGVAVAEISNTSSFRISRMPSARLTASMVR